MVARKQSSYIFKYQQQESHCMTVKSNVWDIVNKIFLEQVKTKCISSFDSSSECRNIVSWLVLICTLYIQFL